MAWLTYVPEILVVVIAGIVTTTTFNLEKMGIQILGKYDGGFQLPSLPTRFLFSFSFFEILNQ
jgi:hypothetical protein